MTDDLAPRPDRSDPDEAASGRLAARGEGALDATGPEAGALGPAGEAVRALYAARGWDEASTPGRVLESRPAVAGYLRPAAPRPRTALVHLAVHAAVLGGLVALVLLVPWKLRTLLVAPEVHRVGLALEPPPFDLDEVPPGAKGDYARLNDALSARAWARVADEAEALLDAGPEAALRPALVEVVTAASVLQGMDDASVRRRLHFQRAVARYRESATSGAEAPGFRTQYAFVVAMFELQGATGGLSEPTPTRLRSGLEKVLSAVSDLRTRFGEGITADPDIHPRLLKIEGYTLARRLFESDGLWSVGRWFEPEGANVRRWSRLEQVLAEWDALQRGRVDPDHLRLRLWFWEAAYSFCKVPGRDETVRIGAWSRSEARIEAEIAAAEQALGALP